MNKELEELLTKSNYQPEVLEAMMKWISETPEDDLFEILSTPHSDNDDGKQAEQSRELDELLEAAEIPNPQQMVVEQDDKVIVMSNYEFQRSIALVDTMRSSLQAERFSTLSVTAPAVFEQETAHVDVGDNAAECAVMNAANNPMSLDHTFPMYNYDVATGVTSIINKCPPTQPCGEDMVVDRCLTAALNIFPMEVVTNEPPGASSTAGIIPVASTSWIRTSNAGRKKKPIERELPSGATKRQRSARNSQVFREKKLARENNLPLDLVALKARLKTLQKEDKELKAKIATKKLNRS